MCPVLQITILVSTPVSANIHTKLLAQSWSPSWLSRKTNFLRAIKRKLGFGYSDRDVANDTFAKKNECSDEADVIYTDKSVTLSDGKCGLHSSLPFTRQSSIVGVSEHFRNENQFAFVFIPKGPLKLHVGNPVYWEYVPNVIKAHLLIKSSGLPNYLCCRIPVQSHLNINNWRHYLINY